MTLQWDGTCKSRYLIEPQHPVPTAKQIPIILTRVERRVSFYSYERSPSGILDGRDENLELKVRWWCMEKNLAYE
jgi:hypothetical protein